MILTLSPSKTMDFSPIDTLDTMKNFSSVEKKLVTHPKYIKNSHILCDVMKKFSVSEIMKLMKVSEKIAQVNVQRFQDWNINFRFPKKIDSSQNILESKPALFSFTGDVYRGFELEKYTEENFLFAEKNMRILSGLYGILSPFSLIKPYRLEMGTRLQFSFFNPSSTQPIEVKNLYEFWREKLTTDFNAQLAGKTWVNLSSVEYSKVIDRKKISSPIIDIDFVTEKNGKKKVIGIFAKRHRGRMSNWVIKNFLRSPEDLKNYTNDGFSFSAEDSTAEKFVFLQKI